MEKVNAQGLIHMITNVNAILGTRIFLMSQSIPAMVNVRRYY